MNEPSYGAQAVPMAATPSNICTGCDTPRHEAITAIANGAMACCPDCSTLTVEDRNAIRAIKAVPVAMAERLPREGDVLRRGDDDWCWGQERSLFTGNAAPRWRIMRVSALKDEAVNWLPHWAFPLPEAQP